MNEDNKPIGVMVLVTLAISLCWAVGLVLLCLNCAGVIHIPGWIVGAHFWVPYLVFIVAFGGVLLHRCLKDKNGK